MSLTSFSSRHLRSRRNFLRTTAATLAASAMGTGLAPHAVAENENENEKRKQADPKPIPGGTPGLNGAFHVYAPGPPNLSFTDPPDSEPATITDFKGFAGLTYISGNVVRTHRKTGQTRLLPFVDADMRFMQGVYRGVDGRVRQGTFALI
jgi:hypothetical protein